MFSFLFCFVCLFACFGGFYFGGGGVFFILFTFLAQIFVWYTIQKHFIITLKTYKEYICKNNLKYDINYMFVLLLFIVLIHMHCTLIYFQKSNQAETVSIISFLCIIFLLDHIISSCISILCSFL